MVPKAASDVIDSVIEGLATLSGTVVAKHVQLYGLVCRDEVDSSDGQSTHRFEPIVMLLEKGKAKYA